MGFFEKLGQGLKKTRDSIFGTIADMVSAGEITDELYDELEEQLILADTGAGVAVQLVDELRARVRSQRLKTGDEALAALKDIVKEHMQAERQFDLSGHPAVILIIGVNGVGKTTSIAKLAHYYRDAGKTVLLAAGDTSAPPRPNSLACGPSARACPWCAIRRGQTPPPWYSMRCSPPRQRARTSSSAIRRAACTIKRTSWPSLPK